MGFTHKSSKIWAKRILYLWEVIMVTLEKIQKRLAESIKQSGISHMKLAEALHVTQSSIAHYVRGDYLPALDTLANLCKILDVSPAYILCFE